jgi:hypothetical protein
MGAPEGLFGHCPEHNEPVEEIPMETCGQPRDARGRFAKKPRTAPQPAPAPRECTRQDNPYVGLPNSELVNIIRQNIWDGEIDVNNATHEQLAEFVAMKERIMRERTENPQPQAQPQVEQPAVNSGNETVNQFLEMLGNFAREAEHNPALAEAIGRFMPRH